jgi:hypothetical protein
MREQDFHGRLEGQHDHLRYRRQRDDRLVRQRMVGKLSAKAERFEGANLAAATTKDAPGVKFIKLFSLSPTKRANKPECFP